MKSEKQEIPKNLNDYTKSKLIKELEETKKNLEKIEKLILNHNQELKLKQEKKEEFENKLKILNNLSKQIY